ncbi:MAG: DUF4863 family protein [Planctomycetes bacterium]|nr:DUF4863 family protein [Planctomycetota bacterium]
MLDSFLPLLKAAQGLDLAAPAAARAELVKRFDPAGKAAQALNAELKALLEAGKVAERGALPVKYGRVAKSGAPTLDFSIDVVHMNGAGPLHRHPNGEVNYCVALEGKPSFDGQPPGWVVFPPASQHVPTVAGGTMLIVYLLPQGAIEFLAKS